MIDGQEKELLLLTGSYADAADPGISLFLYDIAADSLRRVSGVKGVLNPSFVIFNWDGSKVYAVGEGHGDTSTVNTIAIDADTLSMRLVDSRYAGGEAPCHVALSPDGKHLLTANYVGGSISIFNLDDDGIPVGDPQVIQFHGHGEHPRRQTQPHAHFVTFTPDGRRLWVSDLGTDRIHTFPVTGGRALVDEAVMADVYIAPGAGPRHVAFHPSLQRAYLIDEIDGMVNVLDTAGDVPAVVQRVLADTAGGHGCGDIHITPDGRFVYASNRLKGDGLAIFSVDIRTGLLTPAGNILTGPHPRNFDITPDGSRLLVGARDANAIEVYAIDTLTGTLSPAAPPVHIPKPACLKLRRR